MLCCGIFKSSSRTPSPSCVDAGRSLYQHAATREMKLVQLQVLFRHGARTPINFVKGIELATYDQSLGDDLPETMFNYQVVKFKDGEVAEDSSLECDLKHIKLKGGCHASMLTTVGQRQMFELGHRIGDGYLEELEITRFSKDWIQLRTTHLSRTINSLRCFLAGMFGCDNLKEVGPIPFVVKTILEEDLFPNKLTCPTLRLTTDIALIRLSGLASFKHDRDVLLKALNLPKYESIDFAALRDEISCRSAHGLPLPPQLIPHIGTIEENASRTLYAVYSGKIAFNPFDRSKAETDVNVTRLAIGRLIHTIMSKMEKYIQDNISAKMYLYSGHDTSLTPMMEALGIWDMVWPPFAANIAFELYKREKDSSYFVRVLYCGQPKTIRDACCPLIPFDDFRKSLLRYRLPPYLYTKSCLSPILFTDFDE